MKKVPGLAAAMLLLSSLLFAGGVYVSADASFNLPVKGWESADIQNGFEDAGLDGKIYGGAFGEIGIGYEFNNIFRVGLKGGAGFNQTPAAILYTLPVALDMNLRLFSIGPVEIRTGLLLGGYGRILDKTLYLGPYGGVELGADVRFSEHFIFGLGAGVNLYFDLYNSFKGLNIELDAIPVSMTMKYVF